MSSVSIRRLCGLGLGGVLLVTTLLSTSAPAAAESRRERIAALEQLNERWTGAKCQLRKNWRIRKRSDEGWHKSGFLETSSDEFKRILLRLRVRDRAALSKRMRGDDLLAGTVFECLGFRFREEKELDNLYLAMRSWNEGVDAEILVWVGAWMAKPDLKALPAIERFLRLHILDITPRSEQLTSTRPSSSSSSLSAEERARAAAFFAGEGPATPPRPSGPSGSPAPAAPVANGSSATAGGDVTYRPAVEILAVSVQPPQVGAGERVELVVNYTVSGLPPGTRFAVTETRSLSYGERALTSSSADTSRGNGTYTSSLEAPIPAAAEAGIYRLTVDVGLPGAEPASGSALFEVVR